MTSYQPQVGDHLCCVNVSGARDTLEMYQVYEVEKTYSDDKGNVIGVKVKELDSDFWVLAHFEPAPLRYFFCTNGITALVCRGHTLMQAIQNAWKRIPTHPLFRDTVMEKEIKPPIPEQLVLIVEKDGYAIMTHKELNKIRDNNEDFKEIPALDFPK